ncbi:MAG TPA: hypothetical protein VFG04_21320 [Planctomycetaceae bacterium]|nr:hypothetical protein [Planctomycetaceae bacterium]
MGAPLPQRGPLTNLFLLGFWTTFLVLALTHHYRACGLLGATLFAWSIIATWMRPTTLLAHLLLSTAFGVWGVVCGLFAAGVNMHPALLFVACWVGFFVFIVGGNSDPTLKKKERGRGF